MPFYSMYLSISWLVKGGPLSHCTTAAIPCVAKFWSNLGIIAAAEVDWTTWASGNLELASVTTSRYSPVGNGPQKLMLTVCQSAGGSGNICRGLGRVSGLLAWHATQASSVLFVSWLIPGNQTFSLSSLLVLTTPWYPSWAKDSAFSCKIVGTTIQVFFRTTSHSSLTVSSCCTFRKSFNSAWSACLCSHGKFSSLCHFLFPISQETHWRVLPCFVALWISCKVIVLRIALAARKCTYSSANDVCLSSPGIAWCER